MGPECFLSREGFTEEATIPKFSLNGSIGIIHVSHEKVREGKATEVKTHSTNN